jgi:hypothetical protein
MNTNLFFEGLGITVDISSTSSTPSTPAAANYTNGTLTDPYTGVNCSHTITIPCLRTMYNVAGYVPQATHQNKIGITGYLGQFANKADLQSFFKAELPAALNSSFQTVLVNGACTQRWASCLYIFRSRPDACLCGGACQVGRTTRRQAMLDRRPTWTPNLALGCRSRLLERSTRLGAPHPLHRMRARQRTPTSLMTTCAAYIVPIYSADVLILFCSVCPLSGYSLCWHCVMEMYRRPFRRATVMMSKPVRTNFPFLSLYITMSARVSNNRIV